jgi:hypothetical protein
MFADRIATLVEASDALLDARVRELETQRRALEAELAATIAVGEARGLHRADGHRSMKCYLRATCNWSNGEVARFRSAARLVNAHPTVGDAWLEGHIGSAQVGELSRAHGHTRIADRLGEFVPALVDHAETLPHDDFRAVMQRFVSLADVDGAHRDRDAIDGRCAQATEAGGSLHLRASGGDPLATAEFLAIFDRFAEAEFRRDRELARRHETVVNGDDDDGDDECAGGVAPPKLRSRRQRNFDALLAMARAAASHEGLESKSGPLVSILCDQRTWSWALAHSGLGAARSLDGRSIDPFTGLPQPADVLDDLLGDPDSLIDRRCVTTNGVPLRPFDVLRAALSGHVRRVVLGAGRRPIDVGRSERVFAGAAREAAKLLVDWCEQPGCDIPAELCEIDHSVEWHEMGRTDQENAGIRCGGHNREKHRSRRKVRRAIDGRNHTFRPDGTIMLPVGCRQPKFEPDDDADDELDTGTSVDEERIMIEAARHRAALLAPPDRRG